MSGGRADERDHVERSSTGRAGRPGRSVEHAGGHPVRLPPRIGPAADVLALQARAGNRAVQRAVETGRPPAIQRLVYADGRDLKGEVLVPKQVVRNPPSNLKWNKGGGASSKGKYNTGFWMLQSDNGLELHVHMGDKGGLLEGGGVAHHFKRGEAQKGTIGNSDLETIFGSRNVTQWTKDTYTIR